jgi:hypothetical protein
MPVDWRIARDIIPLSGGYRNWQIESEYATIFVGWLDGNTPPARDYPVERLGMDVAAEHWLI